MREGETYREFRITPFNSSTVADLGTFLPRESTASRSGCRTLNESLKDCRVVERKVEIRKRVRSVNVIEKVNGTHKYASNSSRARVGLPFSYRR